MNKVMSLYGAATECAESGDAICFGGFTTSRKPHAAIFEVLRQGQTGFTVWMDSVSSDQDIMIDEGHVKAHINCYTASFGYTNISRRFCAVIGVGTLIYEDYSRDVLVLQFHAASLGLPYLPVRLMQGSDLADFWGISKEKRQIPDKLTNLKFVYIENPLSPGERVVAAPIPQLDTVIIHVQKTSPNGTCAIEGDELHDINIIVTTRKVIVTCEELVSNEYIHQEPSQSRVFGECVDAVVYVPFGAWPSQYYNYYDCDDEALKEHDKTSKYQDKEDAGCQIAKGEEKAEKEGLPHTTPVNLETFHGHLDRWVYGCRDNNDVLGRIGGAYLASLKVIPGLGYAER